MIRAFIFHICVVVAIVIVAKRSLSPAHDIPLRIRLRHYVFLSFLAVMNISGLSQASWTFARVLEGNMLARMEHYFVAFRELPPVLALMIWGYGIIGKSVTALLIVGVARSSRWSRAVLLKLFPFLVLAHGAASLISMRGPRELTFVQSRSTEYVIAFCFWCLLAWPYVFAYRFYRSAVSDILFTDTGDSPTEIQGHQTKKNGSRS